MTSFAKMFNTLKTSVYDKYCENPARLMIFTGTLSWLLSCVAQVGAVVFNEKLTSKDKKFLIPQEIADGAVNVGLFMGITAGLKNITEKTLETGKVMFAETKAPLQKVLNDKNLTLSQALKLNDNKISKILVNQADIDKFTKLKGGATLATVLTGSIISCNILTPLIRNYIGAKWQSKLTTPAEQTLTPTQPLAVKINQNPIKKINSPNVYNNFYTSSNLKI